MSSTKPTIQPARARQRLLRGATSTGTSRITGARTRPARLRGCTNPTNTSRPLLRLSALLAAAALTLSACGGTVTLNSADKSPTAAPTDIAGSPTVAEVKAGFVAILDDGLGQLGHEITDEVRENYTQCLADESYNELSPEGRQAIAFQGDEEVMSIPDRLAVSEASTTCRKHIDKLIIPGSNSTIEGKK
ncbi:MAG: hypothetical protein QM705_10940 [Ancrocorticia sp.]